MLFRQAASAYQPNRSLLSQYLAFPPNRSSAAGSPVSTIATMTLAAVANNIAMLLARGAIHLVDPKQLR